MPRRSLELPVHTAVLRYLRTALPDALTFHPANGGDGRGPIAGARLKQMGVVPGIPDLVTLLPGGKVLFIECKAPKGRASALQTDMWIKLRKLGHVCFEARGIDDVRRVLSELQIPTREAA